jgi:hypothetical protein
LGLPYHVRSPIQSDQKHLIDARACLKTREALPACPSRERSALANSQSGVCSSDSPAPATFPAGKVHMSKETIETKDMNRELSVEELAAITGGGKHYNVYSNGGFYSGATVHSPWAKHQKKNKKR